MVEKTGTPAAQVDVESIMSHPGSKRKSCPICGATYGNDACDISKHPTVAELKKTLGKTTLYNRP